MKRQILAVAIAAALMISPLKAFAAEDSVDLPTPSGRWVFDSVDDSGNAANTASEGGEAAVLVGSRYSVKEAEGVTAVYLDGQKKSGNASEENGYIRLPITYNAAEDPIAISFWMKPENPAPATGKASTTPVLQASKTLLTFTAVSRDAVELPMRSAMAGGADLSVNATVDQWQQVVYVADPEENTITIYIDGKAALNKSGLTLPNDSSAVVIGRHIKEQQDNEHYKGYIRNVAYYDETLTEVQVQELYDQEKEQFAPDETAREERRYTFEDANGNSLLEDSRTVGELYEGASIVDGGLSGKALSLDGTGYAKITETIDFSKGPVTLSVWIKPDAGSFDVQSFTNTRAVLHQYINDSQGRSILALLHDPPGRLNTYMGNADVKGDASSLVEAGQWNHLAITLDPQGMRVQMYLNGEKVADEALSSSLVAGNSSLLLGKHRADQTLRFVGLMDELYIVDGLLDADEIYAEYERTVPVDMIIEQITQMVNNWPDIKVDGSFNVWEDNIDSIIAEKASGEQLANADKETCLEVKNELRTALELYQALLALDQEVQEQSQFVSKLDSLQSVEKPTGEMNALKTTVDAVQKFLDSVTLQTAIQEVKEQEELLMQAREALEAKLVELGLISIDITTSQELNTFKDGIFGANHRYASSLLENTVSINGYGSWDYVNDRIYPQLQEYLNKMNVSTIRFPGGTVANLYQWKRGIGPQEERTPTIHGNALTGLPSEYGLDEAARMCEDAGSRMVYVYNIANGSVEDALDLVEYLNAPNDGSNPRGGVDWAAVRAENGHPEPYNVTQFEMGNEFYLEGQQYWTVGSGYQARYANGGEIEFQGNFANLSGNKLRPYQPVDQLDWTANASVASGEANLVKYFRYVPVKEGTASVYVDGEEWRIVDTLEGQGGDSKVCTVDYETGEITFGDGVNGAVVPKGSQIRTKYTAVLDGFKDYGKALKEFGAELGLDIEVYSCIHDTAFYSAMASHEGHEGWWDGVAYHPYGNANQYSGTVLNYNNYAMLVAENNVNSVKNQLNTLHRYLPDGEICVTEYGILGASAAHKDWLNSTGHGLYLAKSVMGFAEIDGISYANRHSLLDTPGSRDSVGVGQMGVISCYIDYAEDGTILGVKDFTMTPGALMLSMFNTFYGDTVVQTRTYGVPEMTAGGGQISGLDVQATVDADGYTYLAVVNCLQDPASAIVMLDQESTLPTAEVMYVDSPSFNSVNDPENPGNVRIKQDEIKDIAGADSFTYEFPANSLTIIRVKTSGDVQQSAEAEEVIVQGSAAAEAGMRVDLSAKVYPENANTRLVTWKIVEGSSIASIDSETGTVTTSGTGTVKVVAECGDVASVPFVLQVYEEGGLPGAFYTVTITAGEHGTVSPQGEIRVTEGASQSFTIIPNAGYEVDTVLVNGTEVAVDEEGKVTLSDIRENKTVEVSFRKSVDKADLATVIAEAEIALATEDVYTADSLTALETALEAARAIYDATDAAQTEVDAQAEALSAAIQALVKITPEPEDVNKDALLSGLTAAHEILAQENKYTAASLEAYRAVVNAAAKVYEDPNVTQAEIDAAAAALEEAEKLLVENQPGAGGAGDVQNPGPGDVQNPGTGSTDGTDNTSGTAVPTGDNACAIPWIILMAMIACGMISIRFCKRER